MDEKKQFTFENGTVAYSIWYCDNIKIGHSLSKFKDFISQPTSSKNDVVRLHFGLKGAYHFSCKQLNKSFDLLPGHHNMMYSKGFDMIVHNKSLELETFAIQFPKDLFVRIIGESSDPLLHFAKHINQGKSVLFTEKWGSLNPAINSAIQEIIHCKYDGELKKIFLLSKSVELLVLTASGSSIDPAQKNERLKRSHAIHEKLMAVKDIINSQVTNPPNLSEIATMVGLSEFNLKQGFMDNFKTTVFGYLTDQRLNLARQTLLDTKKTTAELALQLGYAKTQYFNNAFKKKFGITPHSIKQLSNLDDRSAVQRSA